MVDKSIFFCVWMLSCPLVRLYCIEMEKPWTNVDMHVGGKIEVKKEIRRNEDEKNPLEVGKKKWKERKENKLWSYLDGVSGAHLGD